MADESADEFEQIISQSIKNEPCTGGDSAPAETVAIGAQLAGPSITGPSPAENPDKDQGEVVSKEAAPLSPEKKVHVKRERTSSASVSGESPASKKPRRESVSRGESVNEDKDGEEGAPSGGRNKRESQEEERMKLQLLVSNFSEEQLNRYEMFRRAAFPKASVKRLMQSIAGTSVSQSVVIAMSGIAKVYVGEIVETALDVLEELGQTGPLQPKHIRESVRRIRQTTGVPTTKHKKVLFH